MTRCVNLLLLLLSVPAVVAQWPPSCTSPASFVGPASCEPAQYQVFFKFGTDAAAATGVLAHKYDFKADHVWQYGGQGGFISNALTALQVALIRCESQVDYVERQVPWCVPPTPCPPPPTDSGPCPPADIPLFTGIWRFLVPLALGCTGAVILSKT
jgi:hypothetical protein